MAMEVSSVREDDNEQKEEAADESSAIPLSPQPLVPRLKTPTAAKTSPGGTNRTSTGRSRRMSSDPSPIAANLQLGKSPSLAGAPPAASTATSSAPIPVQVRCLSRARITTVHGDWFCMVYRNNIDTKEHVCMVYDPLQLDPSLADQIASSSAQTGQSSDDIARLLRQRRPIRSKTLDEVWRPGETDHERLVRGAYVGRLTDQGGVASRPHSECPYPPSDPADVLPLVRLHSACFTGETIGSLRCDCGEQLDEAFAQIAAPQPLPGEDVSHAKSPHRMVTDDEYDETASSSSDLALSAELASDALMTAPPSPGRSARRPLVPGYGVVVYLQQEGRGIGLAEKMRAYSLIDMGADTLSANLMLGHGADERKYDVAAAMLKDLGLTSIRLMSNNPTKIQGLTSEGIDVVERVGMVPRGWQCSPDIVGETDENGSATPDPESIGYEEWKQRRAGATMIGAAATRGAELDKYLKTKAERMGHCEKRASSCIDVIADFRCYLYDSD